MCIGTFLSFNLHPAARTRLRSHTCGARSVFTDAPVAGKNDFSSFAPCAAKSPQGEVSLDFTGKKPGRGAYVCPNSECLKRARKSRALERALDTAIPESVYEEMEKEMANGG